MGASKMTDTKQPRQWWIGITNTGFTKWLTSKHPDETDCRHAFICSDGSEVCLEYVPVIEKSAYDALEAQSETARLMAEHDIENLQTELNGTKRLFAVQVDMVNTIERLEQENAELTNTLHGVLDHGPPGAMLSGAWMKQIERIREFEKEHDQLQKKLQSAKKALKEISRKPTWQYANLTVEIAREALKKLGEK